MGPAWFPLLLLLPGGQGEACDPEECCFRALPYPEEESGQTVPVVCWELAPPAPPSTPGLGSEESCVGRGYGTPAGSEPGPRDLSCYRLPGAGFECIWDYEGPRQGVNHFLRCCIGPRRCCYFEAGEATRVQFSDQAEVPVRRAVSFWVESRGAGGTRRTPRVNVTLSRWVKYDPPQGPIVVSRRAGRLLAQWVATAGQGDARVQFQQRPAGGYWVLGDCDEQDAPGSPDTLDESCLWPLEDGVIREFQFRRRRGRVDPGGPWSSWSSPVCSPLDTPALPQLNVSLGLLGQDGRRQLRLGGQLLRPELPEACANNLPTYHVYLNMLSCACKAKAWAVWPLHTGVTLNISGAAYSLTVASEVGSGPNRSWHIPAHARTDAAPLNISAGPSLHEVGVAHGSTYCVTWEPQHGGGEASCTLLAPLYGTENHSWSQVPGDLLEQETCYRVTVFASALPEKLTSWWTVLSAYYFGDNASTAGIPQLVSVSNVTWGSASLSWAPSPLGTCPGALKGYVVRYQAEDFEPWAPGKLRHRVLRGVSIAGGLDLFLFTERLVGPAQTRVSLVGLQPGRPYRVQVRGDSPWGPGAWSRPVTFHTEAQPSPMSVFLAWTGSFASVFLLGVLGYLGLSRAARCLCPPLPSPCASSATQMPGSQWKQAWLWVSPEDFLEEASLQEALAVTGCLEEAAGMGLDSPGQEPLVGGSETSLNMQQPPGSSKEDSGRRSQGTVHSEINLVVSRLGVVSFGTPHGLQRDP
ncbi:interleukin-12 receptor subunit beta-1 [Suncus etruscus]|uniref:interleukin-12 receptor subunit beta-1 n=1 Tax=Suncus etruscus TaxID=109475 RepID=UPI00210F2F78|nr:interleukin-12 receptor subunit beta-1 [Suncus etruscus]